MTKSLMVQSGMAAIATGRESNLFGTPLSSSTETDCISAATQAATFSLLGFNAIVGTGTNNVRFRDTGANGAQLATRSGVGVASDAVNTDTLAAADTFNLAMTDTGTDPQYAWVKCNVEFASGHGNFHGSSDYNGNIFDLADTTTFLGFAGNNPADGGATVANVAFKIRAYDTIAALQATCEANARTNDSVFKNQKNGADGTGVVTFGAGVTGIVQDTAVGDSIADGDTINATLTLLSGVQDLRVDAVVATLTSSTVKSESWIANRAGIARAASATAHYLPIGGTFSSLTALTETQAKIPVGFAGTASNLRCYLSANTYTVNGTLKLFKNGSAVLTTTITLLGGAGWYENTSDSVTFAATDELSFEFVGGTTGSITIHMVGITLAASVAAADPFKANPLPNPPSLPPPASFQQGIALNLVGQDRFFAADGQGPRYDWPNPRGPEYAISLRSWSLNLQQTTLARPFRQADWPNPRAPDRPVADHVKPIQSALVGQDEGLPRDYDWPNPRGAEYSITLRSWAINLLQSTLEPAQPFRQTEWPNPQWPDRRLSWTERLIPLLAEQAQPFLQTDWPVPPEVQRPSELRTHMWRHNLHGEDAGLPRDYDWPNPRGPEYSITLRSWSINLLQSTLAATDHLAAIDLDGPTLSLSVPLYQPQNLLATLLAAPAQAPFAQFDWPVPGRRDLPVAFLSANLQQTTLAPEQNPFTRFDWVPPPARAAAQSWLPPNLTITLPPPAAADVGEEPWRLWWRRRRI